MSMTCGKATMRLLVRYGVTTVFGIPGLAQSAHLDRDMSAPGPSTNPDNDRANAPTTTPIDGLSYLSSTLDWSTFPVPALTEKNRDDLTACAENILLAREARFPATIAEIYDPEKMPGNLRATHERNDEALERIHFGRQFKNDTERLERLFDLYTKVTGSEELSPKKQRQATRSRGG